jgi:hypothetical protein
MRPGRIRSYFDHPFDSAYGGAAKDRFYPCASGRILVLMHQAYRNRRYSHITERETENINRRMRANKAEREARIDIFFAIGKKNIGQVLISSYINTFADRQFFLDYEYGIA